MFNFLFLLLTQVSQAQDKKMKLDDLMKSYQQFDMFDGSILEAENGKLFTRPPLEWQTVSVGTSIKGIN